LFLRQPQAMGGLYQNSRPGAQPSPYHQGGFCVSSELTLAEGNISIG